MDNNIKKVLVIGSGPIVIGQAAEFDYSGTQAVWSLREEGIEVILVNSNPATIMTDPGIGNKTYIEPLTEEYLVKILNLERPDAVLATLGGQTGLNLGMKLAESGVLEQLGIKLIGCNLETIKKAEDRELFKQLMLELNEPVVESLTVNSLHQATDFADQIGYPVIVRPAYTLGGSGGGIAKSRDELEIIIKNGLSQSPINQCLVEKSIAGFKEIEYEVIRDNKDNCIIVCNMENIDPVGVHTGDSIVVAPSQTLSDQDYQMLRDSSLKIVRALKINGGCNVQFALDPFSSQYYLIEVNPRVSRSSALASKATGYPIAKIAAKIAIGLNLDEIMNPVTQKTYACFEPALDYVVTKIPRWPFDKFNQANRKLGTQMKATGEVMAIARSFEESLLKAIRSLELKISYPYQSLLQASSDKELEDKITYADDERIFAIFELLRRGYTLQKIQDITKIDTWFIHKMANIIEVEKSLITHRSSEVIEKALKIGFSKEVINQLTQTKNDFSLYRWRKCFKMVDTCAAEFSASSPYFYSTSEFSDDLPPAESDKKIVVLGSGPIRIGQGIEFDYASVHAAMILKEQGYKSIIINNNPETVSTDFSISDALYFDPLHVEDVLDILAREKPMGVIAQFGGQTAINLAKAVENAGYQILGTSVASIDMAEDRKQFENLLRELEIVQPLGKTVTNIHEAKAIAQELGFPLMVRPSYVLGGRAMEIVNNIDELQNYLSVAVTINQDSPVLIDRYIIGKEIEVDAICDGENILIPGIMEHIERAGVHSGDSMAVYPPVNLKDEIINEIIRITQKISLGLKAVGLINIQFVLKSNQLYVIEVNPRASRTVPFLSKITGVSMAKVATLCCLGINLKQQGFNQVILPCPKNYFFVKAPVFSAAKLSDVETALGPEMRSTGEVMGIGRSFEEAILKALEATGIKIPSHGKIMLTVADKHKNKVIKFAQRLSRLGFDFMATKGTYKSLVSNNLKSELVSKIDQSGLTIIDAIKSNQVCLIINTLSKDKKVGTDGFKLRRAAAESGIPCFTSLDTFEAILSSLELTRMNITDINRINKQ